MMVSRDVKFFEDTFPYEKAKGEEEEIFTFPKRWENIQHNEYEASADQSLHDHEEPTNENIDQWGPSVTNLDGETEAQEIHGPGNEQSPESDPQSPPIQTDVNADNEVESLDEQIDDTEEINIGSNTEDTVRE
ncbi:hypothetical protein L1987_44784 [Smallanthus sonchifolius]|uniref:Uncharacterized protein n=1 Tax=Smallanthus sonchifolius TaxID=185202 RepID=A0ACB9GRP7_9ASTR|nr:hypothetical protein L1987_44784 [Smallanthus sonchifolius]